MANDALMPRFLYTMLKQLDLKGVSLFSILIYNTSIYFFFHGHPHHHDIQASSPDSFASSSLFSYSKEL